MIYGAVWYSPELTKGFWLCRNIVSRVVEEDQFIIAWKPMYQKGSWEKVNPAR